MRDLHGTFHLQQLLSVLGLPDRRRKKVIHEFVAKKHSFLAFRVLIRPIYPILGEKWARKLPISPDGWAETMQTHYPNDAESDAGSDAHHGNPYLNHGPRLLARARFSGPAAGRNFFFRALSQKNVNFLGKNQKTFFSSK